MSISPHATELLATLLFAVAVLHTFSIKFFQHLALQFPDGSIGENLFHLLGQVEIVFGLWAGVFVGCLAMTRGASHAIHLVEGANFTEPLFVFAIMTVAATRPVLDLAHRVIGAIARWLPLPKETAFFVSVLVIGPLLGSLITEPAAMTVTALLIRDRFFARRPSQRFMYLTLGVLFVNVSIGGILTPFAAPPVLMVAATWKWDLSFMFTHFGWKAAVAVVANTALGATLLRRELGALRPQQKPGFSRRPPIWLQALHLVFLALIVITVNHPAVFMGAFLFFIGLTSITREHQDELQLKESLLVAFFLAGLVVLGGPQRWWLGPLLQGAGPLPLFLGATGLTAFTDNAAITFLGSQIKGISHELQYALVAGAVAGGGLTVIANAPNPAGFAILRESFGAEGISPVRLALGALLPTLIAMGCLWLLPSL